MTLTPREYEVLAAYARLGSHKEAAAELGIGLGTVKNCLGGAYGKLGAVDAFDAFRLLGWLRPPGLDEAPVIGATVALRGAIEDTQRVLADVRSVLGDAA